MKKPTMKKSNARKLVPAVAMLTTSAIMLSTATYAWFTLSKEAEVTGLQMAATTAGGIEISLGQIGDANALGTITAPSMNNKSWKSTVKVSEYYDQLKKIHPSSTNTASTLYYADDTKITAGGVEVADDATITAVSDTGKANNSIRETYNPSGTIAENTTDTNKGYYVDIPMWIRTSKKSDQDIKCEVAIYDIDNNVYDKIDDGDDLTKAVRVSMIPMTANGNKAAVDGSADPITDTAALTPAGGTVSTFAVDYDTYRGGETPATEKGIATSTGATYSDKLDTLAAMGNLYEAQNTIITTAPHVSDTSTNNVLQLAAAEDGKYSVQGFIVRVWLEGESKYCNDANANQDWNIDMHFIAVDRT